jgi:hypothetical protein
MSAVLMREHGVLEPARSVFIDGTCAAPRRTAYEAAVPSGRLVGYEPHGHRQEHHFRGGAAPDQDDGPFMLDAAMNGLMFLAYEAMLCSNAQSTEAL